MARLLVWHYFVLLCRAPQWFSLLSVILGFCYQRPPLQDTYFCVCPGSVRKTNYSGCFRWAGLQHSESEADETVVCAGRRRWPQSWGKPPSAFGRSGHVRLWEAAPGLSGWAFWGTREGDFEESAQGCWCPSLAIPARTRVPVPSCGAGSTDWKEQVFVSKTQSEEDAEPEQEEERASISVHGLLDHLVWKCAQNTCENNIFFLLFLLLGYKAVGKIGEGTFSEVMKLQSLRDGNYYACKHMKQRFER